MSAARSDLARLRYAVLRVEACERELYRCGRGRWQDRAIRGRTWRESRRAAAVMFEQLAEMWERSDWAQRQELARVVVPARGWVFAGVGGDLGRLARWRAEGEREALARW